MMPGIDREERRKKRVPVIGYILFGTGLVTALCQRFEPGWQWVPLAVGAVAITAVGVSIDLPAGRGKGSRRKGSGPAGRDRDDDDGAAGAAAHRWRMLAVVSRLMPRSAGRRWLAEAESLLAEITAARRGTAARSYLLAAPRLVAMMWAREVLRRARPGPRRPG
jgi:hypothetical protein